MNCSWKEEDVYRFAEGTLGPARQAALNAHLEDCGQCRARLAEARRVEGLLRDTVTPVAAPVTLALRVANTVAAEREERRARKGLQLPGRRLSQLLAGAAVALALAVGSYAIAPDAVLALAQRVLFFVPGLGIKPVGDSTLVATGPVSVQSGKLTFAVEALLSDGKQTTVGFTLKGLPGGKTGWETQRQGARPPFLRDAQGRTYVLMTASCGVGGSSDENFVSGELNFEPLPAGLDGVDVVVPLEFYVPPDVVPGVEQMELTAHVTLVPPDASGLPAATPQSAEAIGGGVTLRVTASTVEGDRTVVLVEGEAAEPVRLIDLGRMGGDPASAATLRDDRGRTYKLVQQTREPHLLNDDPLRKDLYFEPVTAGAQQLTLTVPAVQVQIEGSAYVTIPLAGRQPGETFDIDTTVDLGGYKVVLKSATLIDEQLPPGSGELQLYIDVELPAGAEGRMLASFTPHSTGGGGAMWSMGQGGGEQLDGFGVPVESGTQEVTVHLDAPIVVVEGPWDMSFPAR